MKKILLHSITLLVLLVSFFFFGCSNSSADNSSTNNPESNPPSEIEPDGDFVGTIKALDHPITYYVSFWIDKKNPNGDDGGYHYYVYSKPTKEYESRVWTSRAYGSLRITVTNSSIRQGLDVDLYSTDGGNSYTGTFYINSTPFTGTITREWLSITSKNDLIGTWKTDTAEQTKYKFKLTNYLTIKNDFSGTHENVYDYSKATTEFTNAIPELIQKLTEEGYDVDIDTTSKKIWVTLNFSTSDIDEAISKGLLKICQSKQDVQFESIIYSKSS